ncbi:hypothetical protein EI534_18580 [Pseudomonas frederiksbergensis]|uniref:Uncharacterized protein n=1 Tax=Pseudomonas lini TaxID=163011 RepID=A0A7V7TLW2_9PSED|nr:hypothetical protein F7R14_11430 [Pseudomonas lini]MCE6979345.1 hypothetical protein [Pseudomonas frederiksbergensis]MDT9675396.1 hypothetical protein [Pseudomonas sp. JV414]
MVNVDTLGKAFSQGVITGWVSAAIMLGDDQKRKPVNRTQFTTTERLRTRAHMPDSDSAIPPGTD